MKNLTNAINPEVEDFSTIDTSKSLFLNESDSSLTFYRVTMMLILTVSLINPMLEKIHIVIDAQ